jgi:hypothetical protein
MRLSVADIDWTQLTDRERSTLEDVVPLVEEGFALPEIAEQLGVDVAQLEEDWQNLASRVMALSGRTELPPLDDHEYDALVESIRRFGQRYPILRGSPASGLPGEIVDGNHRWRACAQLRIDPWVVDVDGSADELRSLGLVLACARRNLSTSSRRGLVKAELLREPGRSDRSIAADLGVSHVTVGTIRRELEHAGSVDKLTTRTGRDGVEQPATRQSAPRAAEPPRQRTIKVSVPSEMYEHWVGAWVTCTAFRLVERRPGVYELEVQLLDAAAASSDIIQAIDHFAEDLASRAGRTKDDAIDELLNTASQVFARPIGALGDLTQDEASWLLTRVRDLAGVAT